MTRLSDLKVKIFTDGADLASIRSYAAEPYIAGFTTNPTLMRQAGVTDYEAFARQVLAIVGGRSVSFEVFADEPSEMAAQARRIASWGPGISVKIPVTNTAGDPSYPLIKTLSADGIAVNVTAIMTLDQVAAVADALDRKTPAIVSVFAGRIADAGVDPVPLMAEAKRILAGLPKAALLWASPREVLNAVQADQVGCDIITMTPDLLKKLSILGKDLTEYSLDTVRMFRRDALAAGFSIAAADVAIG